MNFVVGSRQAFGGFQSPGSCKGMRRSLFGRHILSAFRRINEGNAEPFVSRSVLTGGHILLHR
eukprot:scaffold8947_cov124-Skeletonema_dohrnii-CCMP3373.AAC.9